MSTRLPPQPVQSSSRCRSVGLDQCLLGRQGRLGSCLGAHGLLVVQLDAAGGILHAHGPTEPSPPGGWMPLAGRRLTSLLDEIDAERFRALSRTAHDAAFGAVLRWSDDCVLRMQGSLIPSGADGQMLLVARLGQEARPDAEADPEHLVRVLDVLPSFIARTRRDGTVAYINASGRALVGWQGPCGDQLHLAGFFPDFDPDIGEAGFVGESRMLRGDGSELPVELSIMPDADGAGASTVIATDMRDRLRDDAARSDQFLEMARTQRMASLGVLVASVAHEINNPNNFVMFNAPVLRSIWNDVVSAVESQAGWSGEQPIGRRTWQWAVETVPKLLDGIDNGSERIKTMVSQLREYTRTPHERQPRECDVNEAACKAVDLVSHLIRKHTRHMIVSIPEDLPPVRISCQDLEQVILNLVVNACQALEDQSQAVALTVQPQLDVRRLQISVQDEGRGMPPEVLQSLGRGYVTTKRTGTGLGMAIVKRLIDQSGGSMHVESRIGLGTVVKVLLPVVEVTT